MWLTLKLNFIDAIVLKFNMAWLKSNLNNVITSISVLSNNSSKTKICKKITAKFSKTMKVVFFDSKTHSTRYTNMRMKIALIPIVGKTHGKIQFCILYKNTQQNINGTTSFMWDNMQHLSFKNKEQEGVP